ncbi:hypothetical protein LCGC14_2029030 [marine sediment metagenome]|uniref:Uncharacterized protein n=1 Tax=marine sediment metagenome TaxID=412755 RepID=A0A0F9HSD1_9ZZZZ
MENQMSEMTTRITAKLFNNLFVSALYGRIAQVNKATTELLAARMREEVVPVELCVGNVSINKVADKVTLSFELSDKKRSKVYETTWTEKELLAMEETVDVCFTRELKIALRSFPN